MHSTRTQQIARWLILVAFAAFGIHQVIYREFVTRAIGGLPTWFPMPRFWAEITGIAMIALALAAGFGKRAGAISLGIICLLSACSLHMPRAMANPFTGSSWVYFGKGLALAGGAFTVAASLRFHLRRIQPDWLIFYGKSSLAAFMVLSGFLHFVYNVFVASLLPPWIPWHFFWTDFAGVLLILGGTGMVIPMTTRWATLLSGIMILSWVPLVHIPLAFKDHGAARSTVPIFEALAFGSTAILAYATEFCRAKTSEESARGCLKKYGAPDRV